MTVNLPRDMVGQFLDFVETFYGTEVVHQTQPNEEIARFFCLSSFFVVRNLEEDADKTAPQVELWSNNLNLLESVEKSWNQTLAAAFEDFEFTEEDLDDEHGRLLETDE
jgi:hypothetical protein